MSVRSSLSRLLTGEIPRVVLGEVDLGDDGGGQWAGEDLTSEVLDDELFVCGVEAEAWGQLHERSIAIAIVIVILKMMRGDMTWA